MSWPSRRRSRTLGAEHAWKVLGVVNEWIRHAETKAAATLAAAGVMGGVLYTFARNEADPSVAFLAAAIVCALSILAGGFGAAMALRPRLRSTRDTKSLIFYAHVAKRYQTDSNKYSQDLGELVSNEAALIAAIADQILANSEIAHRKFRWMILGTLGILTSIASLAFVAMLTYLDV